jgi:hypothetical protein
MRGCQLYRAAEVTTMTTKVTSYPFMTKAQIKAQIDSDDAFVVLCLGIMLDRQTSHEQEAKTTKDRNRRGFMSSHAVKGTTLAQKARGEGLSADETEAARALVSRYTKQLAAHFRQSAIADNPDLAEAARVFSAN